MSVQALATKMLEGALDWVKRLPATLSADVSVDVGRKRLRLAHSRVEALLRQMLRNTKSLEVREWGVLPHAYDVRLTVSGWRLRVEVALLRVELSGGRYKVWVGTPGRLELENAPGASALMMGVLRAGAGKEALRAMLGKLLPPGVQWDGQTLVVEGRLPKEGVVPARLFESSALAMSAEHVSEGVWLAAEAWPGLIDLLQVVFGTDLPRTPLGS